MSKNPNNNDYLSRQYFASSLDLAEPIDQLLDRVTPKTGPNRELYRDMLYTVARMAEGDRNRWDAKIMNQTLKEMEASFSMLERFKRRRKVTVFGSARTKHDHPLYEQAKQLGSLLAQRNLMVITGAGEGIMAAAHEGAGLENSLGLNIELPFEQHANATVHNSNHLLTFNFFFLRKLFFVKEADALVLCPGGFGTLDEALEVLTLVQTGKSPVVPIILMDVEGGTYWDMFLEYLAKELGDNQYISPSDISLMQLVRDPKVAVSEIEKFYRNYHSSRKAPDFMLIRMQHLLTDEAIKTLNSDYRDLCINGHGFVQKVYCSNTHNEPEFANLVRLEFDFNGRDHGRLRQLIDFINETKNWAK